MKELLLFKMRMLQAEIEMNGMIAENKQDFLDLIKSHRISEQDFPM